MPEPAQSIPSRGDEWTNAPPAELDVGILCPVVGTFGGGCLAVEKGGGGGWMVVVEPAGWSVAGCWFWTARLPAGRPVALTVPNPEADWLGSGNMAGGWAEDWLDGNS